jgi:hypothetical protein
MPDTRAPRPVPLALQGLWRRTLLQVPGACDPARATLHDSSTAVFWLQTPHWHGDIRIPADRPGFAGVRSLAECSGPQLRWLLTQQGFAGLTTVDGDTCRWHRRLDHAESLTPDVGRLAFDARGLDEWGVEADYFERWQPVDGSDGHDWQALVTRPDAADGAEPLPPGDAADWLADAGARPRRVFVRSGRWALLMRARALDPVSTREVRAAVAAGQPVDRASLIAAADCEISFAMLGVRSWIVLRSTLPWREGQLLDAPAAALPPPPAPSWSDA